VKVCFSIDRYDSDGDKCENGIYLHLGEVSIRFPNLIEFTNFQINLAAMTKEIRENYVGYAEPDPEAGASQEGGVGA
jgi:hypothetical protein